MVAVSDPVQQGIVASLPKPGQNVTGTSSQVAELMPKPVEFLAAIVPRQQPSQWSATPIIPSMHSAGIA